MPLPSEWLSDIGLAEFAPSAITDIEQYASAWAEVRGETDPEQHSFWAFTELEAAEFAMAPLYRGSFFAGRNEILGDMLPRSHRFPVQVRDLDAADAIYKTDCGPFLEHSRKNRQELRPWDIFAFAGDMSKFELVLGSYDVNILANPRTMQTTLEELGERYTRAGLGDRVVESGLLAAQGIIWFAKLALLRGEDYTSAQDLPYARGRFFPGSGSR